MAKPGLRLPGLRHEISSQQGEKRCAAANSTRRFLYRRRSGCLHRRFSFAARLLLRSRLSSLSLSINLNLQSRNQPRVVSAEDIFRADPEVILASGCGEAVHPAEIATRPSWERLSAVRKRRIHEISGEDILQPEFRLIYGFHHTKRLLAQRTAMPLAI